MHSNSSRVTELSQAVLGFDLPTRVPGAVCTPSPPGSSERARMEVGDVELWPQRVPSRPPRFLEDSPKPGSFPPGEPGFGPACV